MADKFKDRYVLGEGYPLMGNNIEVTGLSKYNIDEVSNLHDCVVLNEFEEFRGKCPKYRLVLERVKQKAKRIPIIAMMKRVQNKTAKHSIRFGRNK